MSSFVPRCWWQSTRCVRLHSRKATLFRLHMKDHPDPWASSADAGGVASSPSLSPETVSRTLEDSSRACVTPSVKEAEASLWHFCSLSPTVAAVLLTACVPC